jgi:hypothetical protein
VSAQLTALLKLPVPFTVATIWTVSPIVAVLGVTVIDEMFGSLYMAVTVVLEFIVTSQVTVLLLAHPDHTTKL